MAELPEGWKATRWEHESNGIVELSASGTHYFGRLYPSDPNLPLRFVGGPKNDGKTGHFDTADEAIAAVEAARKQA